MTPTTPTGRISASIASSRKRICDVIDNLDDDDSEWDFEIDQD